MNEQILENIKVLNDKRKVQELRDSRLFKRLDNGQCPIVYSENYNISFCGIERFHPFDAKKWGNVHKLLIESGKLHFDAVIEPNEPTKEDLKLVHTAQYLRSLQTPCILARILEVATLAIIPFCLANKKLLRPMRHQTGGTILAAKLALQYGWAINLGGGFHHASSKEGGGFCVYADITLALKFLFAANFITKAMIIDLDAHQGNGHERDFKGNDDVFIFDMFNAEIYPYDIEAQEAINRAVKLKCGCSDAEYNYKLTQELDKIFEEFLPQLIIYNAGTDCLCNDPLGRMDLTPEGIIKRDELVFGAARTREIPIAMVTSGGYLHASAQVIASSILNLDVKGLIQLNMNAAKN